MCHEDIIHLSYRTCVQPLRVLGPLAVAPQLYGVRNLWLLCKFQKIEYKISKLPLRPRIPRYQFRFTPQATNSLHMNHFSNMCKYLIKLHANQSISYKAQIDCCHYAKDMSSVRIFLCISFPKLIMNPGILK